MDIGALIQAGGFLWSPFTFALLIGLAATLVWMAFAPSQPLRDVQERLDAYLDRADVLVEEDMRRPFLATAQI